MVSETVAQAMGPGAGMALQYEVKAEHYFAGARADFVAELPADPAARILEIGCGSGDTGALALAAGKAGTYVGVDISARAAEKARRILSDVVVGDVERMEMPWPASSFDAVILSEVLEHLVEPWDVVRRLSGHLKPGGVVLASSPNVAHYHVIASLLRGRFDLDDQGTFDRTHMRWFTPRTYAAMFEQAGLRVETVKPVTPFAPRVQMLSRLSGGRVDHLFMRQIWLKAVKPA